MRFIHECTEADAEMLRQRTLEVAAIAARQTGMPDEQAAAFYLCAYAQESGECAADITFGDETFVLRVERM